MAGGREGVTWGTGSYFFSTGLGFSTDSVLYHKTKTINSRFKKNINERDINIKTIMDVKDSWKRHINTVNQKAKDVS